MFEVNDVSKAALVHRIDPDDPEYWADVKHLRQYEQPGDEWWFWDEARARGDEKLHGLLGIALVRDGEPVRGYTFGVH